ncbi:hypothetical protein V8F20_005530 [Naviculisporaceae sp. PSN 640]
MFRALALISAVSFSGVLAHEHESTSVVTVTLPMIAAPTLHASLITTIGDATSYHIGCPASTTSADPEDESGCWIPEVGFKVLNGPGTLNWALPLDSATGSVDCKVTSDVATCTQSNIYDPAGTTTPEPEVRTTTMSGLSEYTTSVTITAGLENLIKETGTVSPSTSTSTGGIARNTQQAVLAGVAVLAGGAVLL